MSAKPVTASKQILRKQAAKATSASRQIWQRPLFHDRLFIGFVATAFGLCAAVIIILVLRVRPKSFVVPLQYSSLQGFDALGSWYRVYVYGLFSLIVTTGNTAVAIISYGKSRITSFFLIIGTIVINAFTLAIILTLVSHLNL